MSWDFNKGHLERAVETYIFERKKEMENAFLCEIRKIGTENGIETKIILNESKIVDALKNCQDGYKGIKSEVAREIFAEIDVMFRKYYNKCSEPTELKLLEPLCQAERFIINEMWHDVAELKKKYTEEN